CFKRPLKLALEPRHRGTTCQSAVVTRNMAPLIPFDPSHIDLTLDSRSISFENPTGARGHGGTAADGRKGAPNRRVDAGEPGPLAETKGPGGIRHIWMTFREGPPEAMRAILIEAFYDGSDEPSISVPALDFFGLAHGRMVPCVTALTAVQEGRGLNA